MFYEHIRMARASVRAARFRSFLTMLGIIIGVVSVITTVSLGEGVKHQIIGQTGSVGTDLITVRPGKLVKRDANGKITGVNLLSFLSSSVITEKDVNTIASSSGVKTAVPLGVITGTPIYENKNMDEAFVMATIDKFPDMIAQKIEFGNFFTGNDSRRKVAVIGQQVAEKLFLENVPVGKTMQIRGQDFVVGGVLERFPTNPVSPDVDFNNSVLIPYEAGKEITGTELKVYEVLVRPSTGPDQAIQSISSGLKQNHAGQEDFTVLRQSDLVSVADNLLRLINTTVTVMAAVALVVGGVGIMNVMLVSVTERTREIGIRKAVGATNRQIQSQFLIEAAVTSTWGAIIGIFIAGIINLLFRILTNLEPIITWQVVLLSAIVSITIGVVFGMIPAVKVARKDPIEALRSTT